MRLSQLIKQLEEMRNTFGDIRVVVSHEVHDEDGTSREEEEIACVTQGESCVAVWVGEYDGKRLKR